MERCKSTNWTKRSLITRLQVIPRQNPPQRKICLKIFRHWNHSPTNHKASFIWLPKSWCHANHQQDKERSKNNGNHTTNRIIHWKTDCQQCLFSIWQEKLLSLPLGHKRRFCNPTNREKTLGSIRTILWTPSLHSAKQRSWAYLPVPYQPLHGYHLGARGCILSTKGLVA